MSIERLKYPSPPIRFGADELDELLIWADEIGGSDITLQSDMPPFVEVHGRLNAVCDRPLAHSEVMDCISAMYGPNASAILAQGSDIDTAYEIRPDRWTRKRYRINATSIESQGSSGCQITARTLPSKPKDIKTLGIEQPIIDHCCPRQGLVLVTGPTGSGKSTLLSSLIRMLIEDPEAHKKVLTYEAPIEFVYDEIISDMMQNGIMPTAVVSQTEVPKHLPSFAAGVRNAMRRAPEIILVGESRDAETMAACAEASLTGHLVYSTLHSNGVPETVRRMVSVFPSEERQGRSIDLMESLRMVVTQALVPKVGGGRVSVREYLVFDEEVRDRLLTLEPDQWPAESRRLLRDKGQPMGAGAERLLNDGLIDERTFRILARRSSENA